MLSGNKTSRDIGGPASRIEWNTVVEHGLTPQAMEKPVALLLALAAMFLWGSWANTLLLSRIRFELLG